MPPDREHNEVVVVVVRVDEVRINFDRGVCRFKRQRELIRNFCFQVDRAEEEEPLVDAVEDVNEPKTKQKIVSIECMNEWKSSIQSSSNRKIHCHSLQFNI